jgi:arogenate dehydrogenase (NADP+), plant
LAAVTSTEEYIEGVDRMERFLSIWEEEGCRMVSMSCRDHDTYAANSQFITHLMGRILGTQGLVQTPIDTSGFQSVLKLVDSTTADSFDLFYGLYKFNTNSMDTIQQLRAAMDDVVANLKRKEETDQEEQSREVERNWNAENKVESTLNVLYP